MRIDSHKLIFHPERVAGWMGGRNIYPLFLDVSPTSACNHRCVFCGLDFAHKPALLDKKVLLGMLKHLKAAGKDSVKSIMYAGEGEPLLHNGMADIIKATRACGIDAALNTNGVLMDRGFCEKALPSLTWLRVSIDAGTPGTYMKMHGAREGDFEKVLSNLRTAVRIKKDKGLTVTIGTQFLLLKENAPEARRLASILAGTGVDYLIIKPYSKHPLSANNAGTELDYKKMLALERGITRHSGKGFNVIFRKKTMEKKFTAKPYLRCLGSPFWAYISATGDVYPCHTFLGVKEYSFGNLNKDSFTGIWRGKKRAGIMEYFAHEMDATNCRELCRLDEINAYLWELKHPHAHVNFI